MLLSLPDTWNYSVRGLSSITPDGVDGVLTALKELERLGYLERNQQRESNGRMGRAEYVIYEIPRKKPCSESPCTEKPYTVNPDTDTPVTENPAQLSTNRTSTETINKREKKEIQHRYGSYENVLLSDTEYGKLRQEFPGDYQMRVERLSEYMASTGRSYKNHLATIRSWAKREKPKYNPADYTFEEGDPRYRTGCRSRHLGSNQPAGRLRQRQPWCQVSGYETADGWRRRGTDWHDSGAAAFWSVRLSESCRSEDSDRAAKAACYIVRCRQSPQLAIFCALRQVHMLEV